MFHYLTPSPPLNAAKGEIERLRGQVQRLSTELAVNRAKR